MSGRAVVCGVAWSDADTLDRTERVIVGHGDRAMLDKLVRAIPERYRERAARYFAPLLEGNEPCCPGVYEPGLIMWWKRAHEVLT